MKRLFRPSPLRRHEAFMAFWSAQSISQVGSQVSLLAFPLVAAMTLKASPFAMGLLVAAERIPYFLVSLFVGVWVDRLHRRPLLIAADLGRAVLLLLVPIAAWAGLLRMELLYVVALLVGALSVVFEVAAGSYLPTLIDERQLVAGNSRLEGSRAVAEAAGPGLGGWLIAALGAPAALIVDSVSFVASACFLGRIRSVESPPLSANRRASVWREIREGLRFVGGSPILRSLTLTLAVSNIATAILLAVLVLYATRDLGLGPILLGFAFMGSSVGSFLGAVAAERIGTRLGPGRALLAGLATAVPGVALVSLARGAPRSAAIALGAGLFISSAGAALFFITAASLRQQATPDRLLGRMTASIRFITWGTPPFAAVAGGALGEAIGLRATIVVALGIDALAVLTVWRSPLCAVRGQLADDTTSVAAPGDAHPRSSSISCVTTEAPGLNVDHRSRTS